LIVSPSTQLKWGELVSSSSNGNAGGIHRGRPSHDLHIAVFPIDAMTGIRPGADDRRHYNDPCSGWRAERQMLYSR